MYTVDNESRRAMLTLLGAGAAGAIAPDLAGAAYVNTQATEVRGPMMGGREPKLEELPHEIGLVVCLSAPTQELATKIAELSRQPLLHHPIPEWSGSITGFACLFNRAYIERGPYWRFCVHHVVLPHDPMEMFRLDVVTLSA